MVRQRRIQSNITNISTRHKKIKNKHAFNKSSSKANKQGPGRPGPKIVINEYRLHPRRGNCSENDEIKVNEKEGNLGIG